MNKYVVVDIDGTIADCWHRVSFLKQGDKGYKKFLNECDKDKPIKKIIELVELLNLTNMIIFCTAREESQRKKTEAWLKKNVNVSHYILLMKKDNDDRDDNIIKPELLKEAGITLKDVNIILDDRNRVVKAWRKHGYICLQTVEGNY